MTSEHRSLILIVEDDLDLSEMLRAYFDVQGYNIVTAAWGKAAVDLAFERAPDLILLDIRLPDIDGFEVCRQLREKRKTQHIPIIFLTEKRERDDRLQGLELGVVDYITKPFDIQELRLRVRNTLRRMSAHPSENPVTGLPEGDAVDEHIQRIVQAKGKNWGMLMATLRGLDAFRDLYGFVASDDVLRALSLMMSNAVQEIGGPGAFMGHLDHYDFLLSVPVDKLDALHARVVERIGQSVEYFYPSDNRGANARPGERLGLILGRLTTADGPFASAADLKKKALAARRDVSAPPPPNSQ